jgi:hypothetical protein
VTVLDRWADGTVRWALIDFLVSASAGSGETCHIRVNDPVPVPPGIRVEACAGGSSVAVDTGPAQFNVTRGGPFPFSHVTVNACPAIDGKRSFLSIEDADGVVWPIAVGSIDSVDRGWLRTVIVLKSDLHGRHTSGLQLEGRLEFLARSPTVRLSLTLRNVRRAGHPGGIWVLGDAGSVFFRDLSLTLQIPSRSTIRCSPETTSPLRDRPGPLELYQDSSGGESWLSTNHVNRAHRVPLEFCGYRLRSGGTTRTGLRATPVVSLKHETGELSLAMRHFWQNFPKAVEATEDSLVLRLFPRQFGDLHELQGGEQKTHTFAVCFGPDTVTDVPMAWIRHPTLVRARPEWYASTAAVPYLVPREHDLNRLYRQLIDAAVEGLDTFERKREKIDEYGWRHFGDIYGDHEAVRRSGPLPLVSHYNNQYDAIAGFARQFMSTGDTRWWTAFDELAAHVVDIDIYHTVKDKASYNGGMFWHTVHYTDADTATHRSYPRLPGVHGGGPSSEHTYTTGLMLHYFMTGDPRSRDAAAGLAGFVMNIDDGRLSRWRWIDRKPTGLATASGTARYHGPGRGGANSLNALIDGHHLTGDRTFLFKADEIVRRCVHPSDDIEARQLLDAERKWFYTMFLQSLGKYLDYKAQAGELDASYAYARASLLHYARWMARYEYPYLDKPDILEFPTETWAAQDIRKSDVFNFAARHAGPDEKGTFRDRALSFFSYSVRTLEGMSTRTLARPVVVLMTSGFLQSHRDLYPDLGAPPQDAEPDYGAPTVFVPQRVRVERRLAQIAAASIAMSIVAALIYWLVR